jgi:arylsulfatase A-like enzyme
MPLLESTGRRGKEATIPLSVVLGWLLAGLANVTLAATSPVSAGLRRAVALSHAVDLGRHLGFGLTSAFAIWAFRRHFPGTPLAGWAALLVLAISLGALILPTDLEGLAERSAEAWQLSEGLVLGAIVIAIGSAVPLLAALTRPRPLGPGRASRLWAAARRLAALGVGLLAFWLNVTTSTGSNPSAHLYLSWASAVCAAHVLPTLELKALAFANPRRGAVVALLSAWALWALFGPHANGVMIQIARRPSSLHLAALFHTDGGLDTVEAALAARAGPFFARRDELPATAPTARPRPPAPPIVIFFSVDSLRADVLSDAENSRFMPELVGLMHQGTAFSNARAPGSMTKYTLASISSGRYFSQQNWGAGSSHWPTLDTSVHFATLLGRAGIFTAAFPATSWLENGTGIMRGFEHSDWTGDTPGREQHWVGGDHLTRELIGVLEREAARPGFYWVHYLDSHEPFSKGGRAGKKFDRYLRALRVVDGYLGQLRAAVTRLALDERLLWVVMSDHGEAFGEHGSAFHGSTVYDELLRVPLVVKGPGVPVREVGAAVSLIDLGPTVLDWFGLPTPASFMGESLVPFLLGQSRAFRRPIVAETRLKQSMLFDDRRKVIRDLRRRTLEIYDLERDPGELANLSDDVDTDQEEHVLLLRSFFQVHTYRENGYRVPYVK